MKSKKKQVNVSRDVNVIAKSIVDRATGEIPHSKKNLATIKKAKGR